MSGALDRFLCPIQFRAGRQSNCSAV